MTLYSSLKIALYICSTLSWSMSSHTQETPSPITPELSYSPSPTIASPEVTPITAFLSEFYEPDSESGSGTHTLAHLSRGDLQRLDLLGERDGKGMESSTLTESPLSCVADEASPPLPDDIHLTDTPTPISLTTASCVPSKHGSGHMLDVRKSRRFGRDFGEPVRSKDTIYDEFPIYLAKDLPVTRLSSSPPSPLSHDLLPPSSRPEVCNLFSEDETTAVREFLRVWGSNRRVKESSSKLQMGEDEASGTQSDDDYSWEAAEVEDGDGVEDSASCSMLLHEVSQMVGIPLGKSTMEGQSSIASTPPGPDTLDQLIQDSHESSQILGLPSSYQSAALVRSPSVLQDGANVCDRTSSGSCQRVDQPLDVVPQHSVAFGSVVGINASIREDQVGAVAAKSMDVPVILATTSNEVYPVDPCDLVLHRQLGLGRARSTDSNLRRRGQIFNVEKQVMHAASSGAVDLPTSYVPTRDPPPLPPLPAPSVRRVSALDRLETSLSRLKAHNSHQRKSSEVEKANAPLEDRGPSTFTTIRERKHQSSVTAHLPDSRSGHGRHFSSPMAPHQNHLKAPRAATGPVNVRLQERAAKLFPYPENRELTIRSFMEMDVVPPPPPPPRRTSKLGRVAARLSQGIANWGRNITGYRGVKELS